MIEPGSNKKVSVKIFVLNSMKYFSRFPLCRATTSIERKSSMFAFLEKTPFKSIPTWIYISSAGFHFHYTFAHNISCHLLKAIFSFGSGVIAFNLVCQCCSTWSILNYLMFNVNKKAHSLEYFRDCESESTLDSDIFGNVNLKKDKSLHFVLKVRGIPNGEGKLATFHHLLKSGILMLSSNILKTR